MFLPKRRQACSSNSLRNKGYWCLYTCFPYRKSGDSRFIIHTLSVWQRLLHSGTKSLFALKMKVQSTRMKQLHGSSRSPCHSVCIFYARVLLVHAVVPTLVQGSYCTSCGEACLDNICETCCSSNRERAKWRAFSKPSRSSYQPKMLRNEALLYRWLLYILSLAFLAGHPGQNLVGVYSDIYVHLCRPRPSSTAPDT